MNKNYLISSVMLYDNQLNFDYILLGNRTKCPMKTNQALMSMSLKFYLVGMLEIHHVRHIEYGRIST